MTTNFGEVVPDQESASVEEPKTGSYLLGDSSQHCFVVMPYGSNSREIKWFAGWYKEVIEPAVQAAGFRPVLAAAQNRPDAINDEIRSHLALDPMAVIDLGGPTPETEPNPNVMYELGIRHAFNKPHVIIAWAGQRLPFDISNQRAIMEPRELADLGLNRERLTKFLQEAAAGNYYRPMNAVGRVATLDLAEQSLGRNTILGALVEEVRSLKAYFPPQASGKRAAKPHVDKPSPEIALKGSRRSPFGLSGKRNRLKTHKEFVEAGGSEQQWILILADVDRGILQAPPPRQGKLQALLEIAKGYPKDTKVKVDAPADPGAVVTQGGPTENASS